MSLEYLNQNKQFREWKKGRNFSFIVGFMRIFLPIITIIYITSFGFFLMRSKIEKPLSSELARQISNLDSYTSIEAPVFSGHNPEKNKNYSSTAQTAAKKIDEPDRTFLIDTKSILEDDKNISIITSDQGLHDSKKNILYLYQNIKLNTNRGLKANFNEAEIDLTDGIIFSHLPVYIETSSNIIWADDMEMRDNGGKFIFRKKPKMKLLLENNKKDSENISSGE